MGRSTDRHSDSRSGDSRLREFLRRAGPILAAERGWNERSRLKLKSLADDLMLPASLYETAIERLQKGEITWDRFLPLYERKFVQYLRAQFSNAQNKVITATHEKQAIRIARQSFQISNQRARQLLRQVSDELELSRVSHTDAVSHIEDLIVETISTSTFVSSETRERIHDAGRRWGVDRNRVESLIQSAVDANLKTSAPKNPIWLRTLAGAVALLCMGMVAYFAFVIANVSGPGTFSEPDLTDSTMPSERGSTPKWMPALWWSSETIALFSQIRPLLDSHHIPLAGFAADDDAERLSTYRALLQVYLMANDRTEQQTTGKFIARILADEKLETSQKLVGLITERICPPRDQVPDEGDEYRDFFAANELLKTCYDGLFSQAKRSMLNESAIRCTGVSLESSRAEYLQLSHINIARQQWRRLYALCYDEPSRVAKLVEPLGDLSRATANTPMEFEFATVMTLLTVKPSVWQTLTRPLARLIETADQDQLFEIKEKSRTVGNRELADWLTLRLADRIGIATQNVAVSRLREVIDRRLQPGDPTRESTRARWSQLRRIIPNGKLDYDDFASRPTPQLIADAAFYATLAGILHRAETTDDAKFFQLFDRMSQEHPRNVSVRSFKNNPFPQDLPVYGRVTRQPLPSDERSHRESIETLTNADQHSPPVRAVALERLANSADRFRDLTTEEARIIARYLLTVNETPEIIAIEKFASRFTHWANLAIALGDAVTQLDVPIDHALTVSNLVTGLTFEPNSDQSWQPALRRSILQWVALGLQQTAELEGEVTDFHWDELQSYLLELARVRAQVQGVESALINAADSAVELNHQLVEKCLTGLPQLSRRAETIQMLAGNELQEFVFSGQILAECVAQSRAPGSQAQHLRQVVFQEYAARNRTSSSITEQLFNNEVVLLKLWTVPWFD